MARKQCTPQTPHEQKVNHATPGALAQALEMFKQHSLNLTSIDTRPSRRQPWHYIFFVECEYNSNTQNTNDTNDTNTRTGNGTDEVVAKEEEDENGAEEKKGSVIEDLIRHLETVAESCRFWGSWEDRS